MFCRINCLKTPVKAFIHGISAVKSKTSVHCQKEPRDGQSICCSSAHSMICGHTHITCSPLNQSDLDETSVIVRIKYIELFKCCF